MPNARRNLVVTSRLARHLHDHGAKAEPSALEALSDHLRELTELAAMAAEEEDRSAITGEDVATALEAYKN